MTCIVKLLLVTDIDDQDAMSVQARSNKLGSPMSLAKARINNIND